MKREIPYAILAVVIMIIGYIMGSNSALFNYKEIMYRSEKYMNEEELIVKTDVIIIGKATPEPSTDGDEVYALETNDILYGVIPETMKLVFDRSNSRSLEDGKNYVFFLVKDVILENTYHLTSDSQGIFEIYGEEYQNKTMNMEFGKQELLEKVKKLKE